MCSVPWQYDVIHGKAFFKVQPSLAKKNDDDIVVAVMRSCLHGSLSEQVCHFSNINVPWYSTCQVAHIKPSKFFYGVVQEGLAPHFLWSSENSFLILDMGSDRGVIQVLNNAHMRINYFLGPKTFRVVGYIIGWESNMKEYYIHLNIRVEEENCIGKDRFQLWIFID